MTIEVILRYTDLTMTRKLNNIRTMYIIILTQHEILQHYIERASLLYLNSFEVISFRADSFSSSLFNLWYLFPLSKVVFSSQVNDLDYSEKIKIFTTKICEDTQLSFFFWFWLLFFSIFFWPYLATYHSLGEVPYFLCFFFVYYML